MTPCWKTLLVDSYDGHIDRVYPIPCYHQAIAKMPLTLRLYSNERDDILRALQARIKTGGIVTIPIHAASTGGGTSFPVPLLVLGSVGILLVVAGLSRLVWRRLRPSSPS